MNVGFKTFLVLMMVTTVFALSSCLPRTVVTAELPENSRWKLVSLDMNGTKTPALDGTEVTLSFQTSGQVGGNSGCNSFGGSYRVEGTKIQFGEIMSTLMACADPKVMDQEQAYLAALQKISSYELSGDQLTLLNGDQPLLTFTRMP